MTTSFTGYWLTRWPAALPRALAEQLLNRRGEPDPGWTGIGSVGHTFAPTSLDRGALRPGRGRVAPTRLAAAIAELEHIEARFADGGMALEAVWTQLDLGRALAEIDRVRAAETFRPRLPRPRSGVPPRSRAGRARAPRAGRPHVAANAHEPPGRRPARRVHRTRACSRDANRRGSEQSRDREAPLSLPKDGRATRLKRTGKGRRQEPCRARGPPHNAPNEPNAGALIRSRGASRLEARAPPGADNASHDDRDSWRPGNEERNRSSNGPQPFGRGA